MSVKGRHGVECKKKKISTKKLHQVVVLQKNEALVTQKAE